MLINISINNTEEIEPEVGVEIKKWRKSIPPFVQFANIFILLISNYKWPEYEFCNQKLFTKIKFYVHEHSCAK